VEGIHGRHLEDVSVEILPAERLLGYHDSRLEKAAIANADVATVVLNLIVVELDLVPEHEYPESRLPSREGDARGPHVRERRERGRLKGLRAQIQRRGRG
jgi:hypothetical protein